MLKRIILAVPVILAIVNLSAMADNTPYNFLRFIGGARSSALAGAFVTVTDDVNSVFYNPAAISTVEKSNFSATFIKHVLDINSGTACYLIPNHDYGSIAASAAFTSYGSFDYADKDGNRSGTFGASNLAIGATYSNILDTNLYYGVTLKYIYVGLEKESASALALDAGILYKMKDGRTNIGASVLHAGAQLTKLAGSSENLPLDVRLGINHRLKGLPLLLNFTLHHLADDADNFSDKIRNFAIGGELYLGKYIRARVGYDNMVRNFTGVESDKGLTGFSGGLGIYANDFSLDYSFSRYGSSANVHRFGLSLDLK